MTLLDDLVAKGSDDGLRLLYFDLGERTRVAAVASDDHAPAIAALQDARLRIASELLRRQNLSERITALRNAPPIKLPPRARAAAAEQKRSKYILPGRSVPAWKAGSPRRAR
jgi:hypothetical protein